MRRQWNRFLASSTTVAVAILLLAMAAPSAYADDCNEGTYRNRLLKHFNSPSCQKSNTPLQSRLTEVGKSFLGDSDWRKVTARQLRNIVNEIDESLANEKDDDIRKALQELKMGVMKAEVQSDGPPATQLNDALLPDYWKISDDPTAKEPGAVASRVLDTARCIDKEPPDDKACEVTFSSAIWIAERTYITGEVLSFNSLPDRLKLYQAVRDRELRWHSYLYDSQFQYWWELGFNRRLEERCQNGLNSVVGKLVGKSCGRNETDALGNPLGFREPPSYRAILLHPDVGLQYIHHESPGNQLKPALVFQWIGYQWWDWADNKVSNLWGISVVSTVSDLSRTNRVGFGLALHRNEYQVALTSHGGDLTLSINLMLIDRISTLNTKAAESLKAPFK